MVIDKEIIIIGAGPAGISMAAEAIQSGIEESKILVLEKTDAHSFSIRKFYPDQKLVMANYKGHQAMCQGVMCIADSSKGETLSYLDKKIKDFNILVNYNEVVSKITKEDSGSFYIQTDKGNYRSSICIIAIGMMGRPNKPSYRIPSELRKKVTYDITSTKIENKNVLVVGGGDSASEYAQYLIQEGNQVTLSYRKDSFLRMNDINRESLEALERVNKISLILNSNIEELSEHEDKVRVKFQESLDDREFDHIVLALGGTTPKNFLTLLGVEFNGQQPIIKDGFETTINGMFLIGDLSAGGKGGSIITAFNSAHHAMRKICDNYLNCQL